jgi:hypothetical protein
LNLYDQSRWGKLIPSLLEIAILNLNSSFHRLIFSEEDIHNIIKDLKLKLKKPIQCANTNNNCINKSFHNKRNIKKKIISNSEWKTFDKMAKSDYFKNNRYNQNSQINNELSKNNNKNILNNFSVTDKNNNFNNIKFNDNKLAKSYTNKKERINYAISYDKDLNPELIERTFLKRNKNKKGRKKIIQKMTKEEYEKYFRESRNKDKNRKYNEKFDNKGMIKTRDQEKDEINYNNISENKKYNNYITNYNKNENHIYHYMTNNNNNNINKSYNQSNMNKSNSNHSNIGNINSQKGNQIFKNQKLFIINKNNNSNNNSNINMNIDKNN